MAHGKPVVAFETEGIRQWLRHGETGLCIDFGDRVGFRAAVRELIDDRPKLREFGLKAREVWRERFTARAYLDALLAHYQRMVAQVAK
jgi:glycosyltransferase involved in cell wall biosynthesis